MKEQQTIIVFDRVCNLCNGFVDWLIKRDRNRFLYTSLQGEWAKQNLPRATIESMSSVVVVDNGKMLVGAPAVLQVLTRLGSFWASLSSLLNLLPDSFLNWGYALVARNRYRWFGQRETCRLPSPAEQSKFLP